MPCYSDKRLLPYRPDQLYDLVLDVENYPDFLPWCKSCKIKSETDTEILADLRIGFKFFTETFTSRVTFDPYASIHVQYLDGPFKYLKNSWNFVPSTENGVTFTVVDFMIDFEFKSRILQGLIQGVFGEAVQKMVRAFESRAQQLYTLAA
jgi:coenzyme Q-binding protein COQ10